MLPWRQGGHQTLLWRLLGCLRSHSELGGGLWVVPLSSGHIGQTGLAMANLMEAGRRSWGKNTKSMKTHIHITTTVSNYKIQCFVKYCLFVMFVIMVATSVNANSLSWSIRVSWTAQKSISDVERYFRLNRPRFSHWNTCLRKSTLIFCIFQIIWYRCVQLATPSSKTCLSASCLMTVTSLQAVWKLKRWYPPPSWSETV